jgi:hypothetical protein
MPQIIVIADNTTDDGEPPIMLRERVSVSDFESQHFATQLVERIGWAVGDAAAVSQRPIRAAARGRARRRGVQEVAPREAPQPQRAPRSASVVTTAS